MESWKPYKRSKGQNKFQFFLFFKKEIEAVDVFYMALKNSI